MPADPVLLPIPRKVERLSGEFRPRAGQDIRLATNPVELRAAARAIQGAVRMYARQECGIVAGAGGPPQGVAVTIALDSGIAAPQGYRLTIAPIGIEIAAHDAAGAFYGAQTLVQLIRQFPDSIPATSIQDHPDFAARGVMLDISRDKVPTMETLYALVDRLAEWKINQLQLYTEHTFAYRAHPEVWAQASPMTGEEILALDAYCRERLVELVPNQNSFGHMERWLRLPRYRPLAEAPEGFDLPWGGRMEHPFSLCPLDPGALSLLQGMYDELLPHFTSPLFNVGCDETWDLGQGRSKAECQARGAEHVYLDFLLSIYRALKDRGRTMQFWGDIILHRPDLIPELPKDAVALEWGYEADHPFEKDAGLFAQAGVPFYVCPGTSSWNTIAGRTDNAIGNLANAAENGLKAGAIGFLNTDWGDNGHLQYLPVSYPGFAVGAARSWAVDANRDLPVAAALSLHAFEDRAGIVGRLAYDLGNAYQATGKLMGNSSSLFHALIRPVDSPVVEGLTREGIDAAEAAIESAMAPLDSARMAIPDAALIADEFRNAAAMLQFSCALNRYKLDRGAESPDELAARLRGILGEHRRLWLARNRPGGLADSAARLEARLAELTR